MSIFFIFFIQSSGAVELEKCKECHGAVKPTSPTIKDCLICHDTHGGVIEPGTRDPERVHDIHEDAGRITRQKSCQKCHQSPVECTKCHNSHENLESIIMPGYIDNRSQNIQNISCTDCHGQLPQPKGHEDFRDALSKSKHRWMNCRTCHINSDYKMELGFKNIITVQMNDSIRICKICHFSQYEGLKEGNHGTPDQKCIYCHNPHTTQLSGPSGPKFNVTPKEAPTNISTKFRSLTNKIPLLRSTTAMLIISIVMLVIISEHILSKEEEGKKTAYNMVKVNANENTLKTLEIRLESRNIDIINELLERYGINILGMTMQKENRLYKYVIFIDVGKLIDEKDKKDLDEKDLVDKILSIGGVKRVEFTDKYEL